MKKRLICVLLSLAMAVSLLPGWAFADGSAAESDYFYRQLGARAKAIYEKLLGEFGGENAERYYEGTEPVDLIGLEYEGGAIGKEDVEAYIKGNRDLFNDFCAAKDALDLDHSELWWIDSGYLTFRVTWDGADAENGGYHVIIGPGRGETYLLGGERMEKEAVASMVEAVNAKLDAIVEKAKADAQAADHEGKYTETDRMAALVRSVHDQITGGISYRYETDCSTPDNAKFIRTVYALLTHEGVCEAYARALQVCLTRLGVGCVLIHGLQTKGTPEDHMWNAVRLDDGETERWYAVDATWDDPASATRTGELDKSGIDGLDGKENTVYLLVGQDVIGEYWKPSGFVSTGNFEFKYPDIEMSGYAGTTAYGNDSGLKVMYTAGVGSMEDGVPAGVFTVSFKGKGQAEAAKDGIYFLLKMCDVHSDGTIDAMDEWYYLSAALKLLETNKYFYDAPDGVHIYTGTCEYVEVAVTTRKPASYDQWADAANFESYYNDAFFSGSEDEVIAETGLLYNTNSKYEAPPYVYKQTPIPNAQATAGYSYRFDVQYDDELYHPVDTGVAAIDLFEDNTERAMKQRVRVSYTTIQQDLRTGGDMVAQIAGELPFDKNRDGYVDMPGDTLPAGEEVASGLTWRYIYAGDPAACPNSGGDASHVCDVEKGCRIDGVSFNFRASDMWQDDITYYEFRIEGVIGSRSAKFPNVFGVTCAVPGLCPACYRSQGIDWNLWGKPALLDAPENLDLRAMAVAGGTDRETLAKLDEQINKNGFNGRLMLVVEDKSQGAGSREDYEEIENALEDSGVTSGSEIVGRSVFEINFNRICPMVNLKPGQSLRVQVGYPAGITYEDLTRDGSDIELKAYHFTRCDANNKCGQYSEPGHRDGQHIVGVNEITMIPTPYGMVIMCDSFSPFEIVAVKKAPGSQAASAEKTVVVVSDPNGVVTYAKDGAQVEAVGENGNVKFSGTDAVEFTVVPKAGFTVDTVSLGGTEIAVTEGKFTLTSGVEVTKSDVLSVTFVPEDVRAAELAAGQTTVVTQVCTHTSTVKIPEAGKAEAAPTCTQAGYAFEEVCAQCGQVISAAHEIPATGHTLVAVSAGKDATCTEAGQRPVVKCSVEGCGFAASNGEVIEALGHSFTHYTAEGEATCQGVWMTATCERCGAVDRHFETGSAAGHKLSEYTVMEGGGAACTHNAVESAVCQVCGETVTWERAGTALGHVWGSDGFCVRCNKLRCIEEGAHTPVEYGAAAGSCTTVGYEAGQRCGVCGLIIKAPAPILPQGHKYGDDGVCTVCGGRRIHAQDAHTPAVLEVAVSSCEEYAIKPGVYCSVCGDIITPPVLGETGAHQPDTASLVWHWCTNDGVSAVAEVSCAVCGQKEYIPATVSLSCTPTNVPTCTKAGRGTYTAVVTVGSTDYSDSIDNVAVPALGHDTTGFTDNRDATCLTPGTFTGACSVCGETVTVAVGEPLPHSLVEETTEATCTQPGYTVRHCLNCSYTEQAGAIPALGHSYVNGVCTRCGAADPSAGGSTGGSAGDPTGGSTGGTTGDPTGGSTGGSTGGATGDPTGGTTGGTTGGSTGDPTGGSTGGIPGGATVPDETEKPDVPEATEKHPVIREYVPFADVPEGIWYEEDLKYVSTRGIILGDDLGFFNPDSDITRGQMMTLLARFDFVEAASGPDWLAASMAWAVDKGISDGTSPEESITREQFVTMLWRYCGKPVSDADLGVYTDAGSISGYAVEAFRWAVGTGLIKGVTDTELDPAGTATRAQAATMFARFARYIDG